MDVILCVILVLSVMTIIKGVVNLIKKKKDLWKFLTVGVIFLLIVFIYILIILE